MLFVTIETRTALAERAALARKNKRDAATDTALIQDRLVPKKATYFAFVLDDRGNLDVAEDVFLGLEHREGRSMTKQTFESYRDIGHDFNPRFIGKKIVLFSI